MLKRTKTRHETAPIYARITVNRNHCEISVKKRIPVANWNKGKVIIKGKSAEIARLNSYLEQIRSQLTIYFKELVIEKALITTDAVRDKFYGIEKTKKYLKN